jgi:cytoskeletal protein CcmA (bactofilin family)
MIRMGRGSKTTEQQPQPVETPLQQQYQEQQRTNSSGNYYGYQQQEAVHPTSSRAVTESESIARDIKEGRMSGYVGAGTVLTGETNFQAMLRVDGHLTGRVSSENGTLVVGSTGRVDADIIVAAASIGGTVNGDIAAAEKVELGRTARVVGNIQTPRLVIEDGAIFEGNCSMVKAKETLEKRAEEARAAQYSASSAEETIAPAENYETTEMTAEEKTEAVAS